MYEIIKAILDADGTIVIGPTTQPGHPGQLQVTVQSEHGFSTHSRIPEVNQCYDYAIDDLKAGLKIALTNIANDITENQNNLVKALQHAVADPE